MKFLPTAGTIVTQFERETVLTAVNDLSNPKRFDYYIKLFEEMFAHYIGIRYAIAVSSGTAALHLALLALDIDQGDEVILPDLGFVSAAHAICYVGATPVFVDVDIKTWCIDPDEVYKHITKKTKAIMPVYMFGARPNMEELKSFGIPIVEDACPAIGVDKAGTYGIGCFSFQGAKTLAIGEGGMVTTNSKKVHDRIRKMYSCGKATADFYYDEIGYNYRMSNIQAALGVGQLCHLSDLLARKEKIYKWYGAYSDQDFNGGSPWMNTFLTFNRDELREELKEKGIDTRPVFPQMTSFPMYREENVNPNAQVISQLGVNIPSASYLSRKDIEYVKDCIKAYHKGRFE